MLDALHPIRAHPCLASETTSRISLRYSETEDTRPSSHSLAATQRTHFRYKDSNTFGLSTHTSLNPFGIGSTNHPRKTITGRTGRRITPLDATQRKSKYYLPRTRVHMAKT